jgi:hypothetical protein
MEGPMQEISWGWVLRIWVGILWRWILAIFVITFAVLLTCTVVGKAIGQPRLDQLPAVKYSAMASWFLLLVWALGSVLRARHGRYRIALISAEDTVTAFD